MTNSRLWLAMAAGGCACGSTSAWEGPPAEPRRVDGDVIVHSLGSGAFGTRASEMDLYNNVNPNTVNSAFFALGVNMAGEPFTTDKGGVSDFGTAVGPVASPGRVSTLEFYIYTNDFLAANQGLPMQCTVSIELFDTFLDWEPVGSTCGPGMNDSVAEVSLGIYYKDLTVANSLAPLDGTITGYVFTGLNLSSSPVSWTLTDGNYFIDMRCWVYAGGGRPVTIHPNVYPMFNPPDNVCVATAGHYPPLGTSGDFFYQDMDANGIYSSDERTSFGGYPYIANLMFRLATDEGCTFDFTGDGYVNGDDADYAALAFEGGCPL